VHATFHRAKLLLERPAPAQHFLMVPRSRRLRVLDDYIDLVEGWFAGQVFRHLGRTSTRYAGTQHESAQQEDSPTPSCAPALSTSHCRYLFCLEHGVSRFLKHVRNLPTSHR